MSSYNIKDNRQANLVYQEDLTKLTPDRIMEFIEHHSQYQKPRLRMLDDYYRGFNSSILNADTRRQEKGKADHRAVHSFGKYIADFQTAFSVGNAINIKHKTDKRLDEIQDANDYSSIDNELFLDTTRFGRAYEYVYRGNDNIEHSVVLDSLETFIIYDLSVDPQPVMAVRYRPIQVIGNNHQTLNKFLVETWTEKKHVIYKPAYLSSALEEDKSENIYAFPVIEYKNNRFRLGDFENVIPLIDLYDAAQSDTANYMTDLNEAMLVIKGDLETFTQGLAANGGIDPSDEEAVKKLAKTKMDMIKEMKDANMLLLKSGYTASGQQTDVDAGYIHKEYDVTGTEKYKDRLAHDIHKFSHTPDLTDENFAGNASGVAMQYKVLGTIELAATKRKQFQKGLFKRYSIIAELETKSASGLKTDPRTLEFTFKDNMPTDDVAIISAVVSAGAQLPQEYLYQFLPNVKDPKEITKQLQKQQEEQVFNAKKNNGALSDQEQNEHDSDDHNDSEDDDNSENSDGDNDD